MIAKVLNPNFFLGSFILLSVQFSKGQDIIVKKSGARFYAKVLSVDESNIKYIEYNKQAFDFKEPLKISDVLMIRHENGELKVFDKRNATSYAIDFLKYYNRTDFKEETDSVNNFQSITEGAYANLEKFIANTPILPTSKYKISKRAKTDIAVFGGNDYDIVINSEVWGVFQQDTLYLNGQNLTEASRYCKAEILGKYCYLRPAFPSSPELRVQLGLPRKLPRDIGAAFTTFGIMGIIAQDIIEGSTEENLRHLWRVGMIYNLKTGERMLLTKNNIKMLIVMYPSLKSEFDDEMDQNSEDILLYYLERLNALN